MNSVVQSIFLTIANKLGLTLQPKETQRTDFNSYCMSLTGVIADRLATITFMDSGVDIIGDNQRAKYLQEISEYIWAERIIPAVMCAIGTGDVLLKPNTDGASINIDIITNDNFQIVKATGGKIIDVLIRCDRIKQGTSYVERIEHQYLKDGNTVIEQLAYKNGTQVPLSSVDVWANYEPITIISNTNQLLLGRIKNPTVNRLNPNSVDGVPITFGAGDVIEKAKESFNRFNQEFSDKETIIFANRSIFTRDENGERVRLPKGKERLIQKVRGADDNIDTYSPAIRDGSLQNGIDVNLQMIETICGLSNNVLTKPTETFTTATQIRSSLYQTFAYVTKLRASIECGFKNLMNAVNVLLNLNGNVPMGEYEIAYDWGDKMMESSTETFNQLLQLYSIGGCDIARVTAWTLNMDYDEAKEYVAGIEASELNVIGDD